MHTSIHILIHAYQDAHTVTECAKGHQADVRLMAFAHWEDTHTPIHALKHHGYLPRSAMHDHGRTPALHTDPESSTQQSTDSTSRNGTQRYGRIIRYVQCQNFSAKQISDG